MTERDKYIYNCYLETSRKLNNKPFRYRKDFEGFEEREDYAYIVKLSSFFNKFENINIKDFFEAPFYVYKDERVDLQFYTTQRAIKAYTIYQNQFLIDNPDNSQTLIKIKDSFIFIKDFCKTLNIPVTSYIKIKPADAQWHSFLMHLKSRQVSLYALFTFPEFDKILQQYDTEIKSYVFGDTFENLNFYRTKYYSSTKAKKLCVLMYSKLTSVQEHL